MCIREGFRNCEYLLRISASVLLTYHVVYIVESPAALYLLVKKSRLKLIRVQSSTQFPDVSGEVRTSCKCPEELSRLRNR